MKRISALFVTQAWGIEHVVYKFRGTEERERESKKQTESERDRERCGGGARYKIGEKGYRRHMRRRHINRN